MPTRKLTEERKMLKMLQRLRRDAMKIKFMRMMTIPAEMNEKASCGNRSVSARTT